MCFQILALFFFVFLASGGRNGVAGTEFAELIRNVTVPLGREAVLSCVINDLGAFKVGWLRQSDQTIMSYHRKVVTHNPRVTVTHDESRTWNLHIRHVRESDQGCYMCQINTDKMKKQLGCITVQVPPDVIDEESTSDMTVNEGDNVTLTCRAKGKPEPKIIWRREDGHKIAVLLTVTSPAPPAIKGQNHPTWSSRAAKRQPANDVTGAATYRKADDVRMVTHTRSKDVDSYEGEVLRLYRVSRQMMGAYMCIASNDVPPAVSKRVPLNVKFAPLVKAETQLLGAPVGSQIVLKCIIESYPPSINIWMKGRHQDHTMLLDGKKYGIEEGRSGYHTTSTLTIRNFQVTDESSYTCISTNPLGNSEASIRLYEIQQSPAVRSTQSTWTALKTFSTGVVTPLLIESINRKNETKQHSTGFQERVTKAPESGDHRARKASRASPGVTTWSPLHCNLLAGATVAVVVVLQLL